MWIIYNLTYNITHADEIEQTQDFIYPGHTLDVVFNTDCDLAGQIETRQTTATLMVWVSGALVHWHGHTERIIILSTAAGKYVALSKEYNGNVCSKFTQVLWQ
jgi:hypothetical protein